VKHSFVEALCSDVCMARMLSWSESDSGDHGTDPPSLEIVG